MKVLRVAVVGMAVVRGAAMAADAPDPLTLQDCIAQAISHSPELDGLRRQVQAAMFNVQKKRSTTLPSVSGKLDGYVVNGSPVTPFSPFRTAEPGFPNDTVHWGPLAMQAVESTYPVYEHGSILGLNDPPAVSEAKAELSRRQFAQSVSEQKVRLDATSGFISALWYREKLRYQQDMAERAQQRYEGLLRQLAEGVKTADAVQLAVIDEQEVEARIRATEQGLAIALQRLSDLTGVAADGNTALAPVPFDLQPLPRFEDLMAQVIASHPALHVQKAQIEVAHQQLLAVRADRWPTVTLNASFLAAENLRSQSGPRSRNPTAFLSYIEIKNIPLFDFGGRRAAAEESEEMFESEKSRLRAIELELRRAIAQTYTDLGDIDGVLAEGHASYARAEEHLRVASAHGTEGFEDKLVRLQAELDRLSAMVALRAAEVAKTLKYAELQNLTGGAFSLTKQ